MRLRPVRFSARRTACVYSDQPILADSKAASQVTTILPLASFRLHDPVCLPNVLEAEHARWLRPVAARLQHRLRSPAAARSARGSPASRTRNAEGRSGGRLDSQRLRPACVHGGRERTARRESMDRKVAYSPAARFANSSSLRTVFQFRAGVTTPMPFVELLGQLRPCRTRPGCADRPRCTSIPRPPRKFPLAG